MTFTPPTKRTTGQCHGTAHGCEYTEAGVLHTGSCPALYPLQPQPGDEPDTLTKLARTVRAVGMLSSDGRIEELVEHALALISEATEERKALEVLAERRKQERLDALSVTTTEGLNASEWMLRTGKAERERDEARRLHGKLVLDASAKVAALEAKLAAQQETINALSNKATAALRMGQQQGRVELATEVLGMTDAERYLHLSMVVAEDTEH